MILIRVAEASDTGVSKPCPAGSPCPGPLVARTSTAHRSPSEESVSQTGRRSTLSSSPSEPSLGEIFIVNRTQLWRIARKIVRTADLADDVTQDAYLKIVDGPCERQAERPFSYCCQVVRNLALDYCRRHTVECAYRSFDVDVEGVDVPCVASPERTLRERRVLAAIDQALAGLPPRTRQAFELYRLEGLTQRDIAKRMGCSLGLVNGMIAEAAKAIGGCRHLLDSE